MSAVERLGPTLAEKLAAFRSDTYDADGTTIALIELSADQMAEVWADIETAEGSGRVLDVYRLLVLYGAHHGGARVFTTLDEVRRIPGRHIVQMGEKMLALCDMGIDLGNAPGDPGESLPAG